MRTRYGLPLLAAVAAAALTPAPAAAADPFRDVAERVNSRMVKVFGAGGFSRLNNFGTGIVISPDGHILTVANLLLDTPDLVVHLYDGRRMKAEVMVIEAELDAAIIRIKVDGKKPGEPTGLELPYFDFAEAAKRPPVEPGTWVLGFTNQFEIGLRDEAMTVQRGVVAAYTKLAGRQGVFDFRYTGDVYIVDAITNNPGSAGGALTDRQGNLLGVIGRELRNIHTDTWMNYAIPVGAKVDVRTRVGDKDKSEEKTVTVSFPDFVARGMKGEYRPVQRDTSPRTGEGGYTGIIFVPNVLARTPAYVEGVVPGSPAEKAGIRVDDLISFVDGEPVVGITAFQEYLRTRTRPGQTLRLEVRRGESLVTVDLTLGVPPRIGPAPPPKE